MNTTSERDREWESRAASIASAYALDIVSFERIAQGLVNLTYKCATRRGEHYILQRLHPVFSASVNDNIALVTAHLQLRGLRTPRLLRTLAGHSSVSDAGAIWRMLSFVEGRAYDRLTGPAHARAAGALLAQFHRALADFAGELVIERPPIHNYARHRARLAAAQTAHNHHRLAGAVTDLTAVIAQLRRDHAAPEPTAPRLMHGDPKISNMLFAAADDSAVCMIDLDTLAYMPLPLELGDALRSWCNPTAEDAVDARFDIDLLTAALTGYASVARGFATAKEIAAILPATLEIHLELATRFLVDTLEENYFGWDEQRYPSRGQHNLARAQGQVRAAQSLLAQWPAAERALAQAFA